MSDSVNHPSHYTSHPSGVECIEITRLMSFDLGNAFKYLWRCALKGNTLEDLRKTLWYLCDFTSNDFEAGSLNVDAIMYHGDYVLRETWRKVQEVEAKHDPFGASKVFAVMNMIVNAHVYGAKYYIITAKIELEKFIQQSEGIAP